MKKSHLHIYTLSVVSILYVSTTLCLRIAVAQEDMQLALPEGAKARLGKGKIHQLTYTSDGNHLLVASSIGIWIYDAHTGKAEDLFNSRRLHANSVAFSPDKRIYASAGLNYDPTVNLWDYAKRQHKTIQLEHTSYIKSIAFSPDGQTLATGSRDKTVQLTNINTGEHIATLIGHTDSVNTVAYTPDGRTLASGCWDGIVRLWDTDTGELRTSLPEQSEGIATVIFSPDGKTLASVNYNNTGVQLWDVNTGERIHRLRTNRSISCVAFSPDSRTLAAGGWAELSLWDTDTGEHKATLTAHLEPVSSLAFSPDGKTLASASSDELHLWDSMSGVQKGTITGHTQYMRGFALSPDGLTIAIGNFEKIRLWDTVNKVEKSVLFVDEWGNWSLAFSPDGSMLLSELAPYIRVWDVATWTHRTELKTYTGGGVGGSGIEAIVFSPDGRFFANGHTGEPIIWLWYAGFTHKSTLTGHSERITTLAFSPDSRTLASGSYDHTIRLWDVETDANKLTLTGHTKYINSVAFSPDGKILASASWDGTVRLWDTTSGVSKTEIIAKNCASVVFSPDGKILAIGTDHDGTILLWDVDTGTQKTKLTGHSDLVLHIVFSPDGNTLISGSHDGTILLWDLTPAAHTITEREDVNRDGVVNLQDLRYIASHFGQSGLHDTDSDVNTDGFVNIVDLVLVAAALGAGDSAPSAHPDFLKTLTATDVQHWLTAAQHIDSTTPTIERGIVILERLLMALSPKETVLLPNYPNPFNPETWIPYQLAESTDVTVRIYSASGILVRTLIMGYQSAGIYHSRSRAAYWDGKNDVGEQVASGIYFYTLSAGESTMIRRMVIRK